MKKYLLTLFIAVGFSSHTYAAVCPCDAPPECGVRPSSCFARFAKELVGKTYVETNVKYQKQLNISQYLGGGLSAASYGTPLEGNPGGKFYISMTSEDSFLLSFESTLDGHSDVIDSFVISSSEEGPSELIRQSDKVVFKSSLK